MTQPSGTLADEIARLDLEIPVLLNRAEQARQAWAVADQDLRSAQQRLTDLRWRLASAAPPDRPQEATPTRDRMAPVPVPAPPLGEPPVGGAPPETSTRTVQTVLFVLGGLLLGIAAIVFTAVAWVNYGPVVRALILAAVTVLVLAIPPLALWRRLRATAETFAAIGLLLLVLDGVAAWAVDLFGVNAAPGSRYWGLVALTIAVVMAGYRRATRLNGPGIGALLASQAVLPLLVVELHPTVALWSVVASAVALFDVGLLWRHRTGSGYPAAMRVLSRIAYAVALATGLLYATSALIDPPSTVEAARAAGVVVLVGLVALVGAAVDGHETRRALAATFVVLCVTAGAARFVSVAWPQRTGVLLAAVAAAVALLTALVGSRPSPTPSGVRAGGAIVTAVLGLVVGLLALLAAGFTAAAAQPAWSAGLQPAPAYDWQLLAALGLLGLAVAAVGPRAYRTELLLVVGALAVFALPQSVALTWWAPSLVDLVATAGLLGLTVVVRRPRRVGAISAIAAALALHALITALARPASTAWVLGGLAALGLALFAASRPYEGHRRIQGGVGVTVGLGAIPPGVGALLVAGQVQPWWTARLTIVATAAVLVAAVGIRRLAPPLAGYAFGVAIGSAVIWPVVAALSGSDPVGIDAGLGLLLLAAGLLILADSTTARVITGLAAVPAALLLLSDVLPAVLSVLARPYSWLTAIWTGPPAGVGLTPPDSTVDKPFITWSVAVSLALLALAGAVAAYAVRRRFSAAVAGLTVGGPTAILVALAAAQAPWPSVPGATLLIGLAITMSAAIGRSGRPAVWPTAVATVQGVLYLGAGLAGSLSVEWATIAALGSIVVGAGVVAAVGRALPWRVIASVVTVAAAAATAATSGAAADLTLRRVAFLVLAVAIAALGLGSFLRARRRAEGTAIETAGHLAALIAVIFTIGYGSEAALIAVIWGLAVALRALVPGTGPAARTAFAALAAGWILIAWWIRLAHEDVSLVEAYTLPLAAVVLVAGWAALRARPELRSWVAYGPALVAAFLPSLTNVLFTDEPPGAPLRRLLVFIGALAVVVVGSVRRRQAPVVVGGVVLILVALHEIALVWDLVDRWIPIALGGLLLLGLAITYERRRRDVARLRAALGRMT